MNTVSLALRNVLFSMVDASFQLPLVGIVLVGTWGFNADLVTIAEREGISLDQAAGAVTDARSDQGQ